MTLEDIQKLEQARQSKDKYGVIHLLREANFWRAYDWSAWLMTSYPMGEANKPLNVSAKRAKNGYVSAWVGFPVSSLQKFVPEDKYVSFEPVSDTQIDVTIELTDDIREAEYDEIRKAVDEWKENLPLNDSKKNRREGHEASSALPRAMRMSDILAQILAFPLESKSLIECHEFIRDLRRQVSAIF